MDRFAAAIEAFDRANAEDPNRLEIGGVPRPRELVDAERLSEWVRKLKPDASEPLLLAARCQHLRRWVLPRSSFPEGRVGYLKWRSELSRFHAEEATRILESVGYDQETIAAVRRLNLKQGLRSSPDAQTLEDALCLSFLEHELEAFSRKHERPKLIDILRKTWRKMSDSGRQQALQLPLSSDVERLVQEALTVD